MKWSELNWTELRIFLSPISLKLCTPTSHDELIFLYLRISAKQICCGFTECRLAHGVPTCPAAKRSDLPLLHRDHLEEWEPTPHRSKWFSLPFPVVSVIVLVFSLNINSNYDWKCRFMFPLPLSYIFRFLFFSFEYFYKMIAEADLCRQTNRNLTSRIQVFWLFFFIYIIKLWLTVDLWWLVKKKISITRVSGCK